jgi:hypothetical protein
MKTNSTVYTTFNGSGDVDLYGDWKSWTCQRIYSKKFLPKISNQTVQWLITLFAEVVILQCLSFWSMKLGQISSLSNTQTSASFNIVLICIYKLRISQIHIWGNEAQYPSWVRRMIFGRCYIPIISASPTIYVGSACYDSIQIILLSIRNVLFPIHHYPLQLQVKIGSSKARVRLTMPPANHNERSTRTNRSMPLKNKILLK